MSEFQLSDLLEKHEKGICNQQERLILQRYFDSFQDGQEIWQSFSEETRERFKQQIISGINQKIEDHERFKPADYRVFWRVAATILLIATVSAAYFYWQPDADVVVPEIAMITKTATRGEKLTLQLPDASSIRLNSESSVSFPEVFTDAREIWLQGEAFFEVKKSETPFRVITGDLVTTVKGTSFNVRANAEEDLQVTVATGLVEVAAGEQISLLNPGQQASYSLSGKEITTKEVELRKYLAWKDDVLLFDGNTLTQVTTRLSKWYNVDFKFNAEQQGLCDLKLTFDKQPLTNVLEQLKLVTGIDYSLNMDKKEVVVNGIGCMN